MEQPINYDGLLNVQALDDQTKQQLVHYFTNLAKQQAYMAQESQKMAQKFGGAAPTPVLSFRHQPIVQQSKEKIKSDGEVLALMSDIQHEAKVFSYARALQLSELYSDDFVDLPRKKDAKRPCFVGRTMYVYPGVKPHLTRIHGERPDEWKARLAVAAQHLETFYNIEVPKPLQPTIEMGRYILTQKHATVSVEWPQGVELIDFDTPVVDTSIPPVNEANQAQRLLSHAEIAHITFLHGQKNQYQNQIEHAIRKEQNAMKKQQRLLQSTQAHELALQNDSEAMERVERLKAELAQSKKKSDLEAQLDQNGKLLNVRKRKSSSPQHIAQSTTAMSATHSTTAIMSAAHSATAIMSDDDFEQVKVDLLAAVTPKRQRIEPEQVATQEPVQQSQPTLELTVPLTVPLTVQQPPELVQPTPVLPMQPSLTLSAEELENLNSFLSNVQDF